MNLKPKTWLWIFISLYIVVLGTTVCFRHYNFQTQTWDMGAFAQTFWNTVHGRIMFNNLEEAPNHLGVHMAPWLFVLVPGYALFQSPYYLLIIQTIALALGAWPLYLLAREVLKNEKWALFLAGGFLLYPTLQWLNIFDFHEEPFFVPLFLSAFYFVERKNWKRAAIFFALAASTKENAILAVTFAGIYLLLNKEGRKLGLGIIIASLAYFFVAVKVIMPALGGGLIRFDRYANLGATPGEVVQNVINNPLVLVSTVWVKPKIFYVLWLFLPILFLPLLAWTSLILLVPGLAQNLLTLFEFQFTGLYQYDGIILPGVWIGVVYGLKKILERWPPRTRIVFVGLTITIVGAFFLRSPISPLHFPSGFFTSSPRSTAFRELVKFVPPKVSVAAQTNLVPHLSNREHAYMLGREPFPVDIVLIDSKDSFGFPSAEAFQAYYDNYISTDKYEQKILEDRYIILIKK